MTEKYLKRKLMLFLKFIPDDIYLRLIYRIKMGNRLNLKYPKLYNEKLQWLKLNDHKDFYTTMVDKHEMKKFVSEKIGEGYVVPVLGIWESFEDIDFDLLPEKFVLKATNDQGSVLLCNNKSTFDFKNAKKILTNSMNTNFYYVGREWPYKNINPKIIAERMLDSSEGHVGLTDYKYFCFNGTPKLMYISNDLDADPRTDFFDMDFNRLDMRMRDKNSDSIPNKPKFFEEMRHISKILSKDIPQLRVDFYCTAEKVYVGELTFFHNGGFSKIYPEKWMHILGDWIELPNRGEI